MAEVLVLVDHLAGDVRKSTLEMLTIARRLGTPSAVFCGSLSDGAKARLSEFGAQKIYAVDAPEFDEYLNVAKADVVTQLVTSVEPSFVLFAGDGENREVAARVAVRCNAGLITDATDVDASGVVSKNVFAATYTVQAKAEALDLEPAACLGITLGIDFLGAARGDPAALAAGLELVDEVGADACDERLEALVQPVLGSVERAVALDDPAQVARAGFAQLDGRRLVVQANTAQRARRHRSAPFDEDDADDDVSGRIRHVSLVHEFGIERAMREPLWCIEHSAAALLSRRSRARSSR